jgi:serine/threonine-protein kinase
MLAGSPPFGGETALAVAVQHLKKSPDALENLRPDLPPGLCRIVHRMLAKAPEDRYPSARELLRGLRQVQIEHLDEEWPDDLPGWEINEVDTATSIHEATQQLDALMKTAGQGTTGRLGWLAWAAAVVLAFLVGGALAMFLGRQEPLLAAAEVGNEVPRYDNVYSQWVYAIHMPDNEEAWKAVIDHFPDTFFANQARKQLVWLYLRRVEYPKAEEVLNQLALLDGSQQELRAFGLAGLYWVAAQQQQPREAAEALSELLPILPQLRDRQMGRMLRQLFAKTREARTNDQIQQWIDQWEEEPAEAD